MRMRLRNLGKGVTAVPELTEEKAVELGSQLAAEMFIMEMKWTMSSPKQKT